MEHIRTFLHIFAQGSSLLLKLNIGYEKYINTYFIIGLFENFQKIQHLSGNQDVIKITANHYIDTCYGVVGTTF